MTPEEVIRLVLIDFLNWYDPEACHNSPDTAEVVDTFLKERA